MSYLCLILSGASGIVPFGITALYVGLNALLSLGPPGSVGSARWLPCSPSSTPRPW
ncbi:hypothetical protein [Arthrobacter sp. UYEF21]|uniref:hypothetical protein n=1 Tax=Arthrobacter sp. UYEF21 TaxID=1756364 RepID=UPI003391ACA1